VSGLAPGSDAPTWIVGKSTFGRSLTASCRYAMIPNSTIASMTNVVMTGRRMKSAAMFMVVCTGCGAISQRLLHVHFAFRSQSDLAVGDDGVAGIHAASDHRLRFELLHDGDGTHLHAVAAGDYVNILPLLSVLHSL